MDLTAISPEEVDDDTVRRLCTLILYDVTVVKQTDERFLGVAFRLLKDCVTGRLLLFIDLNGMSLDPAWIDPRLIDL